jgi:Tfp pilus assembly protein PilO
MTGRDRIVVIVVSTLLVLAAAWFLGVKPERQKASKLNARISAASSQLATAETELSSARSAQARYSDAYASIVSLGKAVPPVQEVPSLIFQLDQASNHKRVEFASIVTGSTASNGPAAAPAAGASSAAAGVKPTAFTQMPFTFVFNGGFFDLYHLFQQLNQFTERTPAGVLKISGRLLTIQGVKLAQSTGSGKETASNQLSGTITATAYVLPASQGLTGGASASGPAVGGATASSASTPTTPAVARVTP